MAVILVVCKNTGVRLYTTPVTWNRKEWITEMNISNDTINPGDYLTFDDNLGNITTSLVLNVFPDKGGVEVKTEAATIYFADGAEYPNIEVDSSKRLRTGIPVNGVYRDGGNILVAYGEKVYAPTTKKVSFTVNGNTYGEKGNILMMDVIRKNPKNPVFEKSITRTTVEDFDFEDGYLMHVVEYDGLLFLVVDYPDSSSVENGTPSKLGGLAGEVRVLASL